MCHILTVYSKHKYSIHKIRSSALEKGKWTRNPPPKCGNLVLEVTHRNISQVRLHLRRKCCRLGFALSRQYLGIYCAQEKRDWIWVKETLEVQNYIPNDFGVNTWFSLTASTHHIPCALMPWFILLQPFVYYAIKTWEAWTCLPWHRKYPRPCC